jgi:hypothetical protein
MPNHACPNCDRYFGTIGGLNKHLSSAKSCHWFTEERLQQLADTLPDQSDTDDNTEEENNSNTDGANYDPLGDLTLDLDLNIEDDIDVLDVLGDAPNEFHFEPSIDDPTTNDGNAEAGPGPQTAAYRLRLAAMRHILDDDDDTRIIDSDSDSGHVLRYTSPPLPISLDEDGDSEMLPEGANSRFYPFTSELDWKVAQWAVKDSPGHNAFNRLLEVPDVS